jgi:hypothetical protein
VSAPEPQAAPWAAWECFHHSVDESLALFSDVHPMPAAEAHGDSMVRAMLRARRYTWLHARHVLGWSMFESIRMSVRLAEAFGAWTRERNPQRGELAGRLKRVEAEARQPQLASMELRFVNHLMDSAVSTELPLAAMELALYAYEKTQAAERRTGTG